MNSAPPSRRDFVLSLADAIDAYFGDDSRGSVIVVLRGKNKFVLLPVGEPLEPNLKVDFQPNSVLKSDNN